MSFVLSRHALAIAAIFIPYIGLMGGLLTYMACQVRTPLRDGDEETRHLEELDLAA